MEPRTDIGELNDRQKPAWKFRLAEFDDLFSSVNFVSYKKVEIVYQLEYRGCGTNRTRNRGWGPRRSAETQQEPETQEEVCILSHNILVN